MIKRLHLLAILFTFAMVGCQNTDLDSSSVGAGTQQNQGESALARFETFGQGFTEATQIAELAALGFQKIRREDHFLWKTGHLRDELERLYPEEEEMFASYLVSPDESQRITLYLLYRDGEFKALEILAGARRSSDLNRIKEAVWQQFKVRSTLAYKKLLAELGVEELNGVTAEGIGAKMEETRDKISPFELTDAAGLKRFVHFLPGLTFKLTNTEEG